MSSALLKSNIPKYVCCLESKFSLCLALLKLFGFHMSVRCEIHAAMGIGSYCFPDG